MKGRTPMTLQPAALLFGLTGLCCLPVPEAGGETARASTIHLAQASDGAAPSNPSVVPPTGGSSSVPDPGSSAATAAPGSIGRSTDQGIQTPGTAAPGSNTAPSTSSQSPRPTVPTRNGSASLPTLTQPGAALANSPNPSITFGGPQVDVQPVYGSPLRDSGSANGGVPIYSSAPSTLGGPINGTANPYFATLPNGAPTPGQTTATGRGNQAPNGSAFATQQPLGTRAYTRDQTGTFGGTSSGYTAQGVYNGTAAQTANGYGSPYAGTGRPIGGLLSTGVDASGPLRPYIPLDSGPLGRPNSGYGIPNGSRSTHMDGRGIQRLD